MNECSEIVKVYIIILNNEFKRNRRYIALVADAALNTNLTLTLTNIIHTYMINAGIGFDNKIMNLILSHPYIEVHILQWFIWIMKVQHCMDYFIALQYSP